MRRLGILVWLAACSSGDDATPSDTDPHTDDTGTPADVDCEELVPTDGAGITGDVTDGSGAPLTRDQVQVRFCRGDVCLVAGCVKEQTYWFGGLDAGPGSFEVVPVEHDSTLSTPFAPIVLGEGERREIDVVVPELGTRIDLPSEAAELEVVDGLFLTLSDDALNKPSPLDPPPTWVAGVDATSVAPELEGLDGEVLAVWYLSPFDHAAADPAGIPVRIDDPWSVGSGGAVLWVGDYTTASWILVGELQDDGDGKLAPGAGLPRLSTVVVVRKPDE